MDTNIRTAQPRLRSISAAVVALTLAALMLFALHGTALADFSYTVKSGDNLTKIARNNGTTIEALIAANKARFPCLATNASCLQVGWVITIPGGGAQSAASGPGTYVVQSGDSLAKIARKLGVGFNALIAANKQARPCLANPQPCPLQIGWTLNVPGGTVAVSDPAAAYRAYIDAANRREVAGIRAAYHPQAPGFSQLSDDNLKLFVGLLDFYEIKYEIVEVAVVEQSGDTARVRAHVRFTSNDPEAKSGEITGVITLKLFEGNWKLFDGELVELEVLQ